jgi:hypothetical protein
MSLESAHQAFEQQLTTPPAPDNQPTGSEGQSPSGEQTSQEAKLQAVADLSKFEKFVLDGKEMTIEELKKERMLEADYRRKTRELAEERKQHSESAKFDVNYRKDLKVIKAQPWRAAEFYKVYPPEFHDEVRWIETLYQKNPSLWTEGQESQQQQQSAKSNEVDIEKLIEDRISQKLRPLEEKEAREAERAFIAEMDAREAKLKSKYSRAHLQGPFARGVCRS